MIILQNHLAGKLLESSYDESNKIIKLTIQLSEKGITPAAWIKYLGKYRNIGFIIPMDLEDSFMIILEN